MEASKWRVFKDMISIVEATSDQMGLVRDFFREYQSWLNVDVCFQGFEEELANLPDRYVAPKGAIYLAYEDGTAIGCVAIRPTEDSDEAELKRLFIRDAYRGHGIGNKLFLAAIEGARNKGYAAMVLETLPIMKAAKSLYQGYGFTKINSYTNNSDADVECYRYQFDHA